MEERDVTNFKEVLSHFVTGVVVITGATGDGPAGFTCQTFGSLSLEPRLISFSARSSSRSWPRVRSLGVLGVNILAASQEAVARSFATASDDKFEGVSWFPGPTGSPLIEGSIAHLEGTIDSVASHGDHDLVVVAVHFVASHAGSPLVYFQRGYRALA